MVSTATNDFEEMIPLTSSRIFDEQKPPRPSFPSELPSAQLARSPRPPQGEKLPFTEYYDDETIWLRHAPTGPCYEVLVTNLEIAMMKFEGHEYPPGTVRQSSDMHRSLGANNDH